eukprot:evm.model.NODE_125_length_9976_cov_21.073877.2
MIGQIPIVILLSPILLQSAAAPSPPAGSMPAAAAADNSVITLRGSTDIVMEFFEHTITCILYQRGIYPPEDFERKTKYGLALHVAKERGLVDYLGNVLEQLGQWLTSSNVQKLVVVVTGMESNAVLERWVFSVETAQEAATNPQGFQAQKSQKEITSEIAAIIRQVTCSVSFMPLLSERCSFDLLVYTDKNVLVPATWEDSDPRLIQHAEEVRLRSVNTKVHKVDTMVAYRMEPAAQD